MKKAILLILLIFNFSDCFCQDIESVVIQAKQLNEPPTKPGPATYEIKFTKDKSGDLYAKYYFLKGGKNKKIRLKKTIKISKEDIELFSEWRSREKDKFSLSDFGVNIEELNASISMAPFRPKVPIVEEFVITMDTLNYCSQYQSEHSISTGGFVINVFLKTAQDSVNYFSYDSDDKREYKFDLKGYLHLQPLLEDKLPDGFLKNDFFSKEKLIENLLYYKRIIECEGFFYQEFINNNPNRTIQENRMRVGWNFQEYLENRNKP